MKQDKNKTKVFFRKWDDGQVIALFPDWIDSNTVITSYMHIGQHSGATPKLIMELQEADPEEYADLKEELESIGYNLEIH